MFFLNILKISSFRLCFLFFLTFFLTPALSFAGGLGFKIFLSAPDSVFDQNRDSFKILSKSVGIFPVDVIYESRFLSNGVIDPKKIYRLADDLRSNSVAIAVLDAEFGDRFEPSTNLPQKIQVLTTLEKLGVAVPVGLYGTYPQVIYKKRSDYSYYDRLNFQYKDLVDHVDFLSPVLYNYAGRDFDSWYSVASYLVRYAKENGKGKPVYPFVSPVYWDSKLDSADGLRYVTDLSKDEFLRKLRALKDLGADGCIIWIGSRYKVQGGERYKINSMSEWFSAIVEFSGK